MYGLWDLVAHSSTLRICQVPMLGRPWDCFFPFLTHVCRTRQVLPLHRVGRAAILAPHISVRAVGRTFHI